MKVETVLDFSTSGPQPLMFERYYMSNTDYLAGKFRSTRLGRGWRSNFDSSAFFVGSASGNPLRIFIVLPKGRFLPFFHTGGGVFVIGYFDWSSGIWKYGAQGFDAKLVKNAVDSRYELATSDGTLWSYDYDGHLRTITFRGGYEQTLSYDANGNNISVVDSFSRTLDFTYSDQGLLETIDTPDGESLSYEYLGRYDPTLYEQVSSDIIPQGDWALKYAIYPDDTPDPADNPRIQYHYEDTGFPFGLTGITDERGIRTATWTYSSDGRVSSSSHAGGSDLYLFNYDDDARTVTVTNPLGKAAVYHFEEDEWGRNRLTQIEGQPSANCAAADSYYDYDASGFVSEITDAEGNVKTYSRDGQGLPTEIVQGVGATEERTIDLDWDTDLYVPTEVDVTGLTSDFTYDTAGNLTGVTLTDATTHIVPYSTNGETRSWAFTYTTGGLLDTVDGPLSGTGDTIDYDYDSDGYLSQVTNEVGHVTTILSVNGRGQPTSISDPNSVQTDLTYDDRGRLLTITVDPGANEAVTTLEYDDAGNVTKVAAPDSSYMEFGYDDAARLVTITNNEDQRIEFALDRLGNRERVIIYDADAFQRFQERRVFDELGRLLRSIAAYGQTWTVAYDKLNMPVEVTDPRSNTYGYAYDALNRLIRVTDQAAEEIDYGLDVLDQPVSYEDQRDLSTTYVRNGFGDIIRETSPDRGITDIVRNALGLSTQITDARSIVTQYTYDDLGRMLTRTYPTSTGENVTYTYDSTSGGNDGIGRLTSIADEAGSTDLDYGPRGNLVSETRNIGAQTYPVAYAYSDVDAVTTITYPSGRIVEYSYDSLGQISAVATRETISDPLVDMATNVTWLPFGPMSSFTYGNALTLTDTYDQDYFLRSRLVEYPSTGADFVEHDYSRSDEINITAISDDVTPANDLALSYNSRNMLATADGPWGDLSYAYDAVGNRTERALDTGTTTTEAYLYPPTSNRVTSMERDSVLERSLSYDGTGNIVSDDRDGDLFDYTYNHADRLAEVEENSVSVGTYVYDARGLLAIRTVSAGTVHTVQDQGGRIIAELDSSTGDTLREYIWLGDMPLAVVDQIGVSPAIWFVQPDHLNRPEMMTDDGRAIVWQAMWYPWGEAYSVTGSASLNLRFPGQWFQAESALAYNWHRQYDATLARYAQPDPLGVLQTGPALYGYAAGNPVSNTDFAGLQAQVIGCAIGAPFGGAIGCGFGAGVATIGTLIGAGILLSTLGEEECDDADVEKQCEKLLEIDTNTCNGITRRRGKRAGAECHKSATQRYAACLRGHPLPPLNTWNN